MQYTVQQNVIVRLASKVRFTDDVESEDKMSYQLLKMLIDEAEAQVELDLSPRYAYPFVTDAGLPFKKLPDRTLKIIMTLCELMSVMRVLETDFGKGSVVSGDEYFKKQKERYDGIVEQLTGKKKDSGQWTYPPLSGLRLAPHNIAADDGFAGMPVAISQFEDGDFPAKQISDPSETFYNGHLDE